MLASSMAQFGLRIGAGCSAATAGSLKDAAANTSQDASTTGRFVLRGAPAGSHRRFANSIGNHVATRALLAALLGVVAVASAARADCFGDFDDSAGWPSAKKLLELFEPLPDHAGAIHATHHHGRPIGRLDGLLRLRPAWTPETLLRVGLFNVERLELLFYSGTKGVVFRLWPSRYDSWAAYSVRRTSDPATPAAYRFIAADNGRYWRSGSGTFDVAWRSGKLLLRRGDLILLQADFPETPGVALIRGKAMVRGLQVVEGDDCRLPEADTGAQRTAVEPSKLRWLEQPDRDRRLAAGSFRLSRNADGSVAFAGRSDGSRQEANFTTAAFAAPALCAYVLRIDAAVPGTGIVLSDAEGHLRRRLGFVEDTKTGQIVFGPTGGRPSRQRFDFDREMVPFTDGKVWVRIVAGAGVLKWWISVDGETFSRTTFDTLPWEGACARLGLYSESNVSPGSIHLGRLETEPLDGLQGLAPGPLLQTVSLFNSPRSLAQWLEHVDAARPEASPVDKPQWRRACLLRAITESQPASLGQDLCYALGDRLSPELHPVWAAASETQAESLEALQQQSVEEAAAILQSRVAWLNELSQFVRFSGPSKAERFSQLYVRAGQQAAAAGFPRPFSAVHGALLRAPCFMNVGTRLYPRELLRDELLRLAFGGATRAALESARRTLYFLRLGQVDARRVQWGREQPSVEHMLYWAAALPREPVATRNSDGAQAESSILDHPLQIRANKDAFNIFGEFHAAVEAGSYDEACQILSHASFDKARGMLPDPDDPRRFVALGIAIDDAMQRHEPLRRAMQGFSSLGELRLKRAVDEGNRTAVEAITLQFPTTEASAVAWLWLGDRAMSEGNFAVAAGCYGRARRSAGATLRPTLAARARLAGAMLGKDVGPPVTEAVEVGERFIPAQEFERMVAQSLRQASLRTQESRSNTAVPGWLQPPQQHADAKYDRKTLAMEELFTIDGQKIELPESAEPWKVDWGGRQTHLAAVQGILLAGNQMLRGAYAMNDGRRLWAHRQSARPSNSPLARIPVKPVAWGQRVIARRMAGNGLELVCLDITDGELAWQAADDGYALSDPVLAGESVLLASGTGGLGGKASIWLSRLHPATGQPRSRTHLADVSGLSLDRVTAEAALAGDRLVVSVGGAVVCTDMAGRPIWIHRQTWLPPTPARAGPDPAWDARLHRPPVVDGSRVFATQPGVWGVDCVDLHTGRLLRQIPLTEIITTLGMADGLLLVQTNHGVVALDGDNGERVWELDVPEARWIGFEPTTKQVLVIRPTPSDAGTIELAGFSASTSRPTVVWTIDGPVGRGSFFGPVLIHDGGVLTAVADPATPATRKVFGLAPATTQEQTAETAE